MVNKYILFAGVRSSSRQSKWITNGDQCRCYVIHTSFQVIRWEESRTKNARRFRFICPSTCGFTSAKRRVNGQTKERKKKYENFSLHFKKQASWPQLNQIQKLLSYHQPPPQPARKKEYINCIFLSSYSFQFHFPFFSEFFFSLNYKFRFISMTFRCMERRRRSHCQTFKRLAKKCRQTF